MNSHPARFEELERRLLSVEKQNRRLKQLGAALLISVTSLAWEWGPHGGRRRNFWCHDGPRPDEHI